MNILVDVTNLKFNTKRTELRPFNENDLVDLYNYAKVPGVGEMAGWPHHKDINASKEILDMFIEQKKTLAIVIDNHVNGSFGFEKYNEELFPEYKDLRGLEIGFVLAKDYWGQGIFGEVVSTLIDYLFEVQKVDFIIAGHFKSNLQSCRAQEKIGFIKFYEKDDQVYNILKKEDWNK